MMTQMLREAKDQGHVVEIDMLDGTQHYGHWVERVGRKYAAIGHGDGSQPTQDIEIDNIMEIRIVS